MMQDRAVPRTEVRALLGGVTTETVSNWIKDGRLPKPDLQVSRRTVFWKASTLRKAGLAVPDQASQPNRST